jgi:hypothetical protein
MYIYFAIRIYMTVYDLNKVEDYWDTKKMVPYHYITRYMARDRFQELHMRYRVAPQHVTDIYEKVKLFITFRLVHN